MNSLHLLSMHRRDCVLKPRLIPSRIRFPVMKTRNAFSCQPPMNPDFGIRAYSMKHP
jgi:hypothetical protein